MIKFASSYGSFAHVRNSAVDGGGFPRTAQPLDWREVARTLSSMQPADSPQLPLPHVIEEDHCDPRPNPRKRKAAAVARKPPQREMSVGDVVQLNELTKNQMFRYCFMTITEPKSWGAQGFVQALGINGNFGGRAYYRANFEEMEYIGKAGYVPVDDEARKASDCNSAITHDGKY
jgi:hypothetical protein